MTPASVRATLDQAAAVAGGAIAAVVVIVEPCGRIVVVGEPADRALLPWALRVELERATLGESATLCPSCAGHPT